MRRRRRFERAIRRREAELRELARRPRTVTIPEDAFPFEDGTEIVLRQHPAGAPWTCSGCGVELPSYGRLLNHRCETGRTRSR